MRYWIWSEWSPRSRSNLSEIDFSQTPPKKIKYRDTKKFDEIAYKNEILKIEFYKIINSNVEDSYKLLSDTVHDVIEKHAPMKTKILRGNNAPFMTKDLKKEIMNRSRFKNR